MNQARIAKSFVRRAVVSWREHPTQADIEALRTNIERVGLVIRVRWAIVAAVALFSIVAGVVYSFSMDAVELVGNMAIPAVALLFVLAYNTFYQRTYRKLGNIAYLNQAQLLFDILVATVLVYYSGGVLSWFCSMYLVFILEGAFILPQRRHVWVIVGAAAILLGAVFFGGYQGWLPPVDLPFVDASLRENFAFVLVRYLWEITVYIGAAAAGVVMMRTIRQREAELSENLITDELTGLFNNQYFERVLRTECIRAREGDSSLALLLVDVDRLGDVNRMFGVDLGDELLRGIAQLVRDAAENDECDGAPGFAFRVGGEEFAILLPCTAGADAPVTDTKRVEHIAENLRESIGILRVEDVGVTASIGVAFFPHDVTMEMELLDTADAALALATSSGGNVVRYAKRSRVVTDDEG